MNTTLERKTDLACIRIPGDLAVPSDAEQECRVFTPEEQPTGQWILRNRDNPNQCLGRLLNGVSVGIADCNTSSIWDDRPLQTDLATFPLINVATGLCLGGSTTPTLEKCGQETIPSSQLWYDQPGLQDRLASKYWGVYSTLVSEYLEVPLRAATVPEIKAFAAVSGTDWLSYVRGDIRNSWWVLVDPNGYAVSAKLDDNLAHGLFWTDPSFWITKNNMVLKIKDGTVQISNTSVSQAVENFLCLVRSLCTTTQIRIAEQTHGLARVEMSNSIFASVFWEQIAFDAAIAIISLASLAKGAALRNYNGSVTAATMAHWETSSQATRRNPFDGTPKLSRIRPYLQRRNKPNREGRRVPFDGRNTNEPG